MLHILYTSGLASLVVLFLHPIVFDLALYLIHELVLVLLKFNAQIAIFVNAIHRLFFLRYKQIIGREIIRETELGRLHRSARYSVGKFGCRIL